MDIIFIASHNSVGYKIVLDCRVDLHDISTFTTNVQIDDLRIVQLGGSFPYCKAVRPEMDELENINILIVLRE